MVVTGAKRVGATSPWAHYESERLKILQKIPDVLRSKPMSDKLDVDLARIKAGDLPAEKAAAEAEKQGRDFEPVAHERGRLLAIQRQLEGMGANIKKESVAELKTRIISGAQAHANAIAAAQASRAAEGAKPAVDHEQGVPIHLADIPYAAGTSRDGSVVYIHKNIPRFLEIDGTRVNVWKLIARHELDEYRAMKGGASYAEAHNKATHAEDDEAEKEGVTHADYEQAIKPYVDAAKGEATPAGIPLDLNEQPYRDMNEEHLLQGRSGPAASEEGSRSNKQAMPIMCARPRASVRRSSGSWPIGTSANMSTMACARFRMTSYRAPAHNSMLPRSGWTMNAKRAI